MPGHDASSKCLVQCLPSSVLERKHNIHAGKLNLNAIKNANETVALPPSS